MPSTGSPRRRRPAAQTSALARRRAGKDEGRTNTNRKASVEIRRRLAQSLKRLRKADGDTQRSLARRCGFATSYIGNLEQGTVNISLANLEALARGLSCCETDLLRPMS